MSELKEGQSVSREVFSRSLEFAAGLGGAIGLYYATNPAAWTAAQMRWTKRMEEFARKGEAVLIDLAVFFHRMAAANASAYERMKP